MLPIPAHLIHQADQAKAATDMKLAEVVDAVRVELAHHDPTTLWWQLACDWIRGSSPVDVAAALASATVRLAQQ